MDLERLQVVISAKTDQLQKALNNIVNQLAATNKSVNGVESNFNTMSKNGVKAFNDIIKAAKAYNNEIKAIAQYNSKYDIWGGANKQQPWIVSYEEMAKKMIKANNDLKKAQEDLFNFKGDKNILEYGELIQKAGESQDALNQLKAVLTELTGKFDENSTHFRLTSELVELAKQSRETKDEIAGLAKEYELAKEIQSGHISAGNGAEALRFIDSGKNAEEIIKRYEELQLKFAMIRKEIDQTIKLMGGLEIKAPSGLEKFSQNIVDMFSKAKDNATDAMKTIETRWSATLLILAQVAKAFVSIGSAIGKVTVNIGKMMWRMEPLHKMIERLGESLKSLWVRIKRVLVYSTIVSFVRAIKNEIGALITANEELGVALGQAKGAWLTAFMPIYNTVIPIIISLINWLTVLGAKIATLTHRIFGGSIGASKEQAKALKEMGGAAGGAAAEFKPIIAAFDELNRLEEPDAGGGGGAGDWGAIDFDFDEGQMEDYLTWYDWLYDKTEKIIALHKELDKWLQKCADTINWFFKNVLQMFRGDNDQMAEAMINQWRKMGSTLAQALNNFVSSIKWPTIGRALGAGLDLAFQYLTSFIKTFDWTNLGKSLVMGLNGMIWEIDWSNVGELIVAKFNIVWQFLKGWFQNLDYVSIGKALADMLMSAIRSIDLVSLGQTIQAIVHGIGQAFITFCKNFNMLEFAFTLFQKINDAIAAIEWGELAMNIIIGLAEGIWGAIQIVVAAIFGLVDALVTAFCDLLGIQSPSTVFEGYGVNIVEGLLNGLEETWGTIVDFFSNVINNLKQFLSDAWDSIKTTATQKWNAIKDFTTTTATNIKTGVTNAFNNLASAIGSPLNTIKGAFSSAWSGIVSDTASKFGELISNIGGYVSSIGSSISGMLSTIGNGISNAWNSISSFVSGALASLASVQIPAMASGGVITQPTVGLIGEYAGAKHNPEIVTPESLLRSIVGESNDDVANVLVQGFSQIIAAIEDKNTEIRIGDDVISAAAARGNKDFMRRTGRSQFA